MTDAGEAELSNAEVRRRASRGAASAFGRHAVVRLLAFLGTLVLARLIAPEGFGLFVTAQFILSILQALAVGGVVSALVRRREAVSDADYRTALVVQQIIAVTVVALLFLAAPAISAAYDLPPDRVWVFRAMALAVFPLSLKSIPQARLQREFRHDKVAASDVIEYLVYLVAALSMAALGYGVWALVAATLLRYTVGAIAVHLAARSGVRIGYEHQRAAGLIQTALPLQGGILLDLGNRAIVPIVLGGILGLAAVGVTGMATTIVDAVILQPLVLVASVQLRLLARVQDEPERMRTLLGDFYSAGGLVIVPLATLLAIIAPTVLPLILSEPWRQVGFVVSGLVLSSALQVISAPSAQAAKALGDVHAPLVGGIVTLALQLLIVVIAAPRIGIYAYPLSALVSGSIWAVLITSRVARRVGMPPVQALLPILAAAAVAGGIWFAAVSLSTNPWIMVSGLILGGLTYLALLVLLAGQAVGRLLAFAAGAVPARLTGVSAAITTASSTCDRLQLRLPSGARP